MTININSLKFQKVLNAVPADYYDKGVKNNLLQKYWHNKKWQTLYKFLNGATNRLLDIGCADGTTTYKIYKEFPHLKITGLDFYKNAIDFAKKTKPQIKFICADAHKLPFEKNSFDAVCAIEVLEHLHKPSIVLKEINRVLAKNGYLIIGQDTNSLLFRIVWWFWNKGKGHVWNGSHINCVKPEILIKNLKKNGFSIEKVEYINLKMEVFIKARKGKSV